MGISGPHGVSQTGSNSRIEGAKRTSVLCSDGAETQDVTDLDWRKWERACEANPGDRDLLERAIASWRRAGLPIPGWLLQRQIHPPRTFNSVLRFHVYARLPGGEVRRIGRTPHGPELEIPEHTVVVTETVREGDGRVTVRAPSRMSAGRGWRWIGRCRGAEVDERSVARIRLDHSAFE